MSRPIVMMSSATLVASAAAALLACSDDALGPATRTFTSAPIAVGGGTAWTEIMVGRSNEVQSLALVFTASALTNLPPALPNTEFIVPLPAEASTTVFNHVGINWQPNGHPPPMVYTVPHFDVHFYLISTQQRDAMTPADPQFSAKSLRAPDALETPPGYVSDPQGVPRMGAHWTDRDSHEFHGSAFTNTLVYGFYDGKMIFLEPMMTKVFLESMPNETKAIKVPAKYPNPGRYPTSYRVAHDAATQQIRVELTAFETRP